MDSAPGRPREFEIEDALEDAMQVFWSRGYCNTSLVDLIDGTNLSRGSLYKAFGDKRGLFIASLKWYIDRSLDNLAKVLKSGGSGRTAIIDMLNEFSKMSLGEEGRRGCLLVATAMEMTSHDAEVAECVNSGYKRMQNLIEQAIKRGQEEGGIASRRDPQTLARLIMCLSQGMRVLGKTKMTKKEMVGLSEAVLIMLE